MALQGRTLSIKGSVECVEDVLLEGRIDGHIWNENHVVTIGADATVNGDIVARQITVRGAVEGTLLATGRVDIMNAARVTGRVLSSKLMLAEGGLLNGKVEPQQLEAALKVARHRRTEGVPSEIKLDDAKPGDAKPGDAKPGDAKPAEAKAAEPAKARP